MPLGKTVAAAKDAVTLELVNLENLAVDPRMQVRGAGTDPGLVKQYKRAMEAGEVLARALGADPEALLSLVIEALPQELTF